MCMAAVQVSVIWEEEGQGLQAQEYPGIIDQVKEDGHIHVRYPADDDARWHSPADCWRLVCCPAACLPCLLLAVLRCMLAVDNSRLCSTQHAFDKSSFMDERKAVGMFIRERLVVLITWYIICASSIPR
jgi:hypothetical protein